MKGILIRILAGTVLFLAGIAVGVPVCRLYDKAHAPVETVGTVSDATNSPAGSMDDKTMSDELRLRVYDGNLEWFDGVRWNDAGTVEELAAADPIAWPSEAWQTLAAQLAETRAEKHATELAALNRDSGSLSVDEIVAERPQSTARPAASATPKPATPVTTQPTPSAGAASDDNNDSDRNEEPAPAPEPEPAPAPEPEPEPDDTGDGENIEWSGDYE